jgi:hypothetical protein
VGSILEPVLSAGLVELDDLLRGRGYEEGRPSRRRLLVIATAGGLFYGAVMGSYGLSPLQALYSALKVPLLVGVSTLVCLPNFYTVNSVLGLRDDFPLAMRAILTAQGTVAVVLASLAPVTAFLYASVSDYGMAVAANGVIFLVAALAGQVTLSRRYRPLIEANPRHRVGRAAWLTLYIFVAIQMAWVLRPFIGDPSLPTRFVRSGAWGNAYVEVAQLVWSLLTR